MVLDGVGDHTRAKLEDWLSNYARGQDKHLLRFRDWCRERKGCGLHSLDAAELWDELIARATQKPLPQRERPSTATSPMARCHLLPRSAPAS
ncbi:hypothetical protein [Allokutzneria albata]|uniref:hypothetical protein n=1 Tax=Allokutzneria albata TaxID=211114 RepID=UPI0012DD0E58|nr:hypothetical protein [Allokutzneria albata]